MKIKSQAISRSVPGLGPVEIDLFADRLNCQEDRFVSWKPDPAAEAMDAFQVNLGQLKVYAFPPFAMLMSPQQERHPLVLNGTLSLLAWKLSGDKRL